MAKHSYEYYRFTLSEQDMVRNRSPAMTPSQVWMGLMLVTGIVPSPFSILLLNNPRIDFVLLCISSEMYPLQKYISDDIPSVLIVSAF